MNKIEFAKAMAVLQTAYNKEMTLDQIKTWYIFMQDLEIERFKQTIMAIVKKNKFMPSIAEVREEYAKSIMPNRASGPDEWTRVIEMVHKYGYYGKDEAFQELGDYTSYIAKLVGWEKICRSTPEQQTWNRKYFLEEYDAMQERGITKIQLDAKSYINIQYIGHEDEDR